MNELDQFLKDFYDKYAPGTYTPEKGKLIKETYGTDYDGLINDLYGKYKAPIDPNKLGQIKELYGFTAPTAAPTQQQEQRTGFMGAMEQLVESAQTPADPNVEKPLDIVGNAWKRGMNLSETTDIVGFDKAAPTDEGFERIAQLQQEQASTKTSAAYEKFNQAKTFGESLKALAENPAQIIGEVFIESTAGLAGGWEEIAGKAAMGGATGATLGSVIPGMGTAAGLTGGTSAGTVTGMAETSMRLEWAGKFLEALQEAGVDTSDKESLKEAFQNEEILSRAREAAYKKSIPIAIFDLVSGGLAGRLVSKPAKSLLGKIGQGAGEFAVQGALGGGGELAGQVVAGEEINPSSILSEVIGEGATAPVEIAAGAAAYNQSRSEDPAIADAAEDVESTGDPDLDRTIDESYDDIVARLDRLDFDPVSQAEIDKLSEEVRRGIEPFSEVNEENDIRDVEYTPEEAARIQAQGPMPSPQEQEINLDDSESLAGIDAAEAIRNQESERLEFESNFSSDALAQMSEEDEFMKLPGAERSKQRFLTSQEKDAAKQAAYAQKQAERAKKLEEKIAEKQTKAEAPKKVEKSFWDSVSEQPTNLIKEKLEEAKADVANERFTAQSKGRVERLEAELVKREQLKPQVEKKPRVKPQIDPEQQKKDRIVKYKAQLENIKRDKPNKKMKRLEILNENTLDLPEINDLVKKEQEKLKAVGDKKKYSAELKKRTPQERLDLIATGVTSETDKASLSTFKENIDDAIFTKSPEEVAKHATIAEDAYNKLVDSKDMLSLETAEIKSLYNEVKKKFDKALAPLIEAQKKDLEARAKATQDQKSKKDDYLTKIAKATELNNPVSTEQSIKEYKAWRKTQGLKDLSDDEIKKHAAAEYYKTRAHNQIKGDALEARAREQKVLREKAEAEKKANKGNIKSKVSGVVTDEQILSKYIKNSTSYKQIENLFAQKLIPGIEDLFEFIHENMTDEVTRFNSKWAIILKKHFENNADEEIRNTVNTLLELKEFSDKALDEARERKNTAEFGSKEWMDAVDHFGRVLGVSSGLTGGQQKGSDKIVEEAGNTFLKRVKEKYGWTPELQRGYNAFKGAVRYGQFGDAKEIFQTRFAPKQLSAPNPAIDLINKELGLSDDADVKMMRPTPLDDLSPDLARFVAAMKDIKPLTGEEFFKTITSMYGESKEYISGIKSLYLLANSVAKKVTNGRGIEFYLADLNGLGNLGMFVSDVLKNRQVLLIDKHALGDTSAHELMHAVSEGISNILLSKSDKKLGPLMGIDLARKEFRANIHGLLTNLRTDVYDMYTQIIRKTERGTELTEKEYAFLTLIEAYAKAANHNFDMYDVRTLRKLRNDIFERRNGYNYFLVDADELLSEAFSSPHVAAIMSMMEAPTKVEGKNLSYFRQLYDSLMGFVKEIGKKLNISFVENSYFKQLSAIMETMEKTYLTNDNINALDKINLPAKHQAIVNEIHARVTAQGGINPLKPELLKLIGYIADQWYKDPSIQSEDGVQRAVDEINAKSTKNKLGKPEVILIWRKIQKYRQALADAKGIQQFAKDYAATSRTTSGEWSMPEYHTSKAFKRDLDDFTGVNLDTLSRLKVQVIQEAIVSLIGGSVPKQGAYNLLNKMKAEEYLRNLLPTKGKYAKNPGVYIPKKLSVSILANPATFSTIISKYDKKVAQKLFNTIYGGLLEARTNSQTESSDFLEKLFNIANDRKERLNHSDFARVGMYGMAFSTQLPPSHPEYWNEVELNLSLAVQNSQNKLKAFQDEAYKDLPERMIREELKIAQELHELILARKTMDGILTPNQQKLYDEFRAFASKYENDMERNTKGVWGGKFKRQFNYFPTFTLGKVDSTSIQGDELIPNDHINSLWEGLQKNKNYGKVIARQSGFTKDKVAPKGYFYDYDAISIAHKFAPATLFDLYASRELKTLNQLLNGAQGERVKVGGQDLKDVMSFPAIQGLNRQIKSIVGATTLRDADISRNMKWLQNAKNSVATALLATTGQFLVQASSAFPAAIIMDPKGFPKALKVLTGFEQGVLNFSILRNFLKENGLSIQLRDALFERWQTTEDIQKEGLNRHTEGWKIAAERMATSALRRGDKFAARLVWFSAYFANGGTLENPSRSAVLAAERAVGVMQNMSDVSFAAPIFRSNDGAQRVLMQMLFAFKSFAMNAALNTIYSSKYFFSRAEARQVFIANLGMAAAYQAVTQFMIRPGYSAAAQVIGEALGGEVDDEEEEKNYSKGEEFLWNWFWGASLGQALPTIADNLARLWVSEAHEKLSDDPNYDTYKDFPMYAPRTMKDVSSESLGVYGDVLNSGLDITAAGVESMIRLAEGEEIDGNELFFRMLKDLAMFEKRIPFRGDIQKLIRNWENKVRAEKRMAGKRKNNSNGDESGTEFEVPEFELPEYEIEISNDPTEIPEIE